MAYSLSELCPQNLGPNFSKVVHLLLLITLDIKSSSDATAVAAVVGIDSVVGAFASDNADGAFADTALVFSCCCVDDAPSASTDDDPAVAAADLVTLDDFCFAGTVFLVDAVAAAFALGSAVVNIDSADVADSDAFFFGADPAAVFATDSADVAAVDAAAVAPDAAAAAAVAPDAAGAAAASSGGGFATCND